MIQTLSQQHRLYLLQSGLSDTIITRRGYYTVTTQKELAVLGFASSQQRAPGLVIPLYRVDGKQAWCQLRPDIPRVENRNGKARIIKYEMPAGQHMLLDVHPNGSKQGVDDFLAADHTVSDLRAFAHPHPPHPKPTREPLRQELPPPVPYPVDALGPILAPMVYQFVPWCSNGGVFAASSAAMEDAIMTYSFDVPEDSPASRQAIACAHRGLRMHPLAPRSKKPSLRGWQHLATTDESTIRAWAQHCPQANWGLAAGAASGMLMTREDLLRWEAATQDTIDVKRIYIEIADDLEARLLLSQIIYWCFPAKDGTPKTQHFLQCNDQRRKRRACTLFALHKPPPPWPFHGSLYPHGALVCLQQHFAQRRH